MARQLILISPRGQRLVIDMAAGTVESVASTPDDAETHLVIEPAPPKPVVVAPPAPVIPDDGPPPAPLDIWATLIGGGPMLPPGAQFEALRGPQVLVTLAGRFATMSEDGVIAITLGPPDGD
jgi:hypothetical protein